MKHIYLILLFTFFSGASYGNSPILITETFNDTPLKDVFTRLNANYHLKIAYSDNAIEEYSVNMSINDQTVFEVFNRILDQTTLTFEQLEEDIIIVKKKPKTISTQNSFPIIGVVMDASSMERLPHAYIWLKSEHENFLTNVDGYFSVSLSQLPAEIMISYLGYQDTTLVINESMVNKRLYINLDANPTQLNEVVITGNKNNDFEIDSRNDKIDFNPKVAYSMPSAGEIDLMRTIQLLPGINATNEFSSGLSIQGGNTNQNLFLLDGFTIYHMDHFFGYFSAINPVAVKSMQVYKSGYDARYGGRTSGIIDISGKEGNLSKTSGSLGINLLSINTSLEIPLKKETSSLFFSGRRSYTDILSTSLFEKIFTKFSSSLSDEYNGNSINNGGMGHHGNMQSNPGISTLNYNIKPEFYYSDLNLKFSSKVGLRNHLSVSFYDSNDILNFKESRLTNVGDTLNVTTNKLGLVNWGNVGTSLKWSTLWNEFHYTNGLITYSNYQSRYNESSTSINTDLLNNSDEYSSTFEQNNSINDFTIKIDHEWSFSNEQMIKFGLQSSVLGTTYSSNTQDTTFVEHKEKRKNLTTLYGLGVFNLLDKLMLDIGLRGNYYSVTNKWYAEPRISISLPVSEKLNFKTSYGKYYQFINQSNTKNALQGSRDFWLLADGINIPVQKAQHITAGIDFSSENLLLNVQYFKKDFDGLLEYAFSSGGLITEFDNYENMFFQGKGSSQGIEFLIKKPGRVVNAWLGYTYGIVKYVFNELNEGKPFYADHDQRHEINGYVSYNLGKVELYGTWIFGSGSPYSKTIGSSTGQNQNEEFQSHVTVIEVEEKNGARLPPYHRLDVGAKYSHFWGDINMIVALNIFNLYNRHNVIDYNYYLIMGGHANGHGMSSPIVQSNIITSLGTTPNISLTINF